MNKDAPVIHEPGVYFGLPESIYHADRALGSTDLKRLLTSAPDYWWESRWNPMRPEDRETPAKLWGSAFHKLVLEGKAAFEKVYARAPDPDDFPGALRTIDDLRKALGSAGITAPSKARKEDLLDLVRKSIAGAVIWDDVLARHAKECAARGAQTLSNDVYAEVIISAGHVAKNAALRSAFQNGRPEVSIFWEQSGVRCKARVDFFRIQQNVDLKSFRNSAGMPVERAVIQSIASYRYDVQAAHYLNGRAAAIELLQAGRVFGTGVPALAWRHAVAEQDPKKLEHWLVFYQAEGAPISLLRRFKASSPVIEAAGADVARAIGVWRDNWERYGTAPWEFEDPMPDPDVDMDQLPAWLRTGATI